MSLNIHTRTTISFVPRPQRIFFCRPVHYPPGRGVKEVGKEWGGSLDNDVDGESLRTSTDSVSTFRAGLFAEVPSRKPPHQTIRNSEGGARRRWGPTDTVSVKFPINFLGLDPQWTRLEEGPLNGGLPLDPEQRIFQEGPTDPRGPGTVTDRTHLPPFPGPGIRNLLLRRTSSLLTPFPRT